MSNMNKIILSIVVVVIAFAFGRHTSPEKVKVEVKTVEVEKVVTKVVHEVITIVEKPDGSKETTITRDSKNDSSTISKNTGSSTEEIISKNKLNISLLTGTELPLTNPKLIYGASVTGSLIGPITMGAWGMTNSTLGVSIGLNL